MDTILIIGAGAAGLMAAYELSAAGYTVVILEAAERAGGRIATQTGHGFSLPVEAGAEFVHGSLPVTLRLLKEARITYRPVKGKMHRVRKGEWIRQDLFSGDWEELTHRMGQLKEDLPIELFLDTYFPGERYALLRSSVRGFAEGYDLVDPGRASTLALYREWQEEGEEEYRVDGGYGRLIQHLVDCCIARGGVIHLSKPVRSVRWQKGGVELECMDGEVFTGRRVIITVSLGILQLAPGMPSAITFTPEIPAYRQAAREMGYGSVVKVLMEFKTCFWEDGIGFVLSDEAVPTWWMQYPSRIPLLTAWIAATAMRNFQMMGAEEQLNACIQSLASIFRVGQDFLREQLVAYSIHDWMKAPYILGGYSYETVGSEAARKQIHQPVEDTLFFSGEALYEGQALATVEAALCSGQEAAEKIKARY
ncbi:MAG TPA: NAD(P)/FAD-dependent oxidoreductase [Puia sp.]|nr:NAD(P)/FAD-dependent oxidoreductase [Puia sp.]